MAPFSIHLEPLGGSRYKYLKLPSRDWDGNPPNENVGIHASLMFGRSFEVDCGVCQKDNSWKGTRSVKLQTND